MEFKTELARGTEVSFAGNAISGTGTVGFAAETEIGPVIVTDRTPFHPLSASWPDQPGDVGSVTLADGTEVKVINSITGTLDTATGALWIQQAPPERTDTQESVVVHVLGEKIDVSPLFGTAVQLVVDEAYREALSLQHSGVHLASLALNAVSAAFWSKEFSTLDTLGQPNFDQAAVERSEITAEKSIDSYRIGKSLRKKGFDRDGFVADLGAREAAINEALAAMLGEAAEVVVTPASGPLGERRSWSTTVNGKAISMFCGGTHVRNLSAIQSIRVTLEAHDEGFVMTTVTQ